MLPSFSSLDDCCLEPWQQIVATGALDGRERMGKCRQGIIRIFYLILHKVQKSKQKPASSLSGGRLVASISCLDLACCGRSSPPQAPSCQVLALSGAPSTNTVHPVFCASIAGHQVAFSPLSSFASSISSSSMSWRPSPSPPLLLLFENCSLCSGT